MRGGASPDLEDVPDEKPSVRLGARFAEACRLWALEERGLTFREPQRAMQFVLANWTELHEACLIADGVKNKIATEPIVAAMIDALITAGEIRALGVDDQTRMASQFATLMLQQAGFTFPPEGEE